MFSLFLSIILNAALCYYGIKVFRNLLIKNNFIDIPSSNKAHKFPTPRGGGLVVVLVLLVNFYFSQFVSPTQYWNKILLPFTIPILV